jgi:hypothetical protein
MRRGHVPHISISDDNHHVTEAIGDLYGNDSDTESSNRSSRPLSFLPDSLSESIHTPFNPFPDLAPPAKSPLRPQMQIDSKPQLSTSPNGAGSMRPNGQLSPPLSRTSSDTASQQFPLNDLDYESSPAGLAQELSNLQAIRRMSMDVHNADPDLPSFQSYSSGPVSPPALSDDDDSQQLFWVPARLHPELAPKEFKTFIEEKVHTIRRRSGDLSSSLSPDGAMGRQDSGGGLRRKKSMLSRQIDTGSGYKDGAERLERKRSGNQSNGGLSNLHELEHIVEDPAAIVRRMSMSRSPTPESLDGDAPIIPGGMGGGMGTLKRSTRTTYRRGSLRSAGRSVPLSRRLVSRNAETDTEESPATSPDRPDMPELPKMPGINRAQSEPINGAFEPSNFSRPRRNSPTEEERRPGSAEPQGRPGSVEPEQEERRGQKPKAFHSRIASNGRTSAHLPGYNAPAPTLASPVPQIIETPPPTEPERRQQYQLPERTTSRQPPPQQQQQQARHQQHQQHPQQQPNGPRVQAQPAPQQQRHSSGSRQNKHAQAAQNSPIKPQQSLDDLTQHPSAIPGNHSTRVDNLSIIPNLPDEKKDKKSKDKKDEVSRKTSWGWLVGNDKKEKEKEEREKEAAKKVKNKLSKPQEKPDDTRLDLLQSASGNRGRESVVLDRESVKLEEERKKESNRKASGDKKEKEPGLLSSIFGGGKKKGEKESGHKKNVSRGLSPEPPPRILKPDIDYNWTRFSILEERAIYRMAHIKLANPRRELYSQVLLSNFMYSYLAKVQQMHPQIQIGNSKQAKLAVAQQKKEQQQQQQQAQQQQQQQQQQQSHQPEEFSQYQRYQQQVSQESDT